MAPIDAKAEVTMQASTDPTEAVSTLPECWDVKIKMCEWFIAYADSKTQNGRLLILQNMFVDAWLTKCFFFSPSDKGWIQINWDILNLNQNKIPNAWYISEILKMFTNYMWKKLIFKKHDLHFDEHF